VKLVSGQYLHGHRLQDWDPIAAHDIAESQATRKEQYKSALRVILTLLMAHGDDVKTLLSPTEPVVARGDSPIPGA